MKMTRRSFLKSAAAAAAGSMLVTGAAVSAYAEEEAAAASGFEGEVPAADAYPIAPEEFGSGEVKYTMEEVSDGWIRVTNEGGAVLGYSPASGVQLIQVDGYAFKDLNGDGQLDLYEDWRQPAELRAADIVSQMTLEEKTALRVSPLTMSADATQELALTLGDAEESTLETYVKDRGLRYCDNMAYLMSFSLDNASNLVAWNNHIQETAESSRLGLPFIIACDPNSKLMGCTNQMTQAASFDPEKVNQLWQKVAKAYRAIGIAMLLGPQVDLETDPRALTATVFTEDPKLAADLTNAAINGMQSTYDEDGNDLGWGSDSVICQMKHFAANNAIEAGRSYHYDYGKYTIFPGNAFETQLIPYVDGGFYLTGQTAQTGAIMMSYSIPWSTDGSLGNREACALNPYMVGLARKLGFNGLIATDAIGVSQYDYDGSFADATAASQAALMFRNGVDQILSGEFSLESLAEAYEQMTQELGEEEAEANFTSAAYNAALPMFLTKLIDNPYLETAASMEYLNSVEMVGTDNADATKEGIVLLKNHTGAIAASDGSTKTVYIPKIYESSFNFMTGETTGEWKLPFSEKACNLYFNVVTDTMDENGDVVRASDEELASCDFALVKINNPDTGSGYDSESGEYIPISLQYSEYKAVNQAVRDPSMAGDCVQSGTSTPYGVADSVETENRSYYGRKTVASNLSDMELVQDVAARMEGKDVVVCINSSGAMVFSEIEPYADSILMMFGRNMMGGSKMGAFTDPSADNFLPLAAGAVEPTALLPLQMPADMDTVEEQLEDVPRDMVCYTDSEGNTYDFAYGMNWSGVIDDERTAAYKAEPQVKLQSVDFE